MGATNCPETPRQKMIGMMYLVYTALLALNVSAEILTGFVTVGNAMDESNKNIAIKLSESYTKFHDAYDNNPDKVGEQWRQAQVVKSISDSLIRAIDDAQCEFVCLVQKQAVIVDHVNNSKRTIPLRDGNGNPLIDSARVALQEGGLSIIDKLDNTDDGTRFFYGKGETPDGKAVELKNKIIDYKRQIKSILGEDSSNVKMSLNVEEDQWNDHEKQMVPWEQLNFHSTIAAADMVVLARLKAEVMNTEFDAINALYARVSADDYKFDKVSVLGRPTATYIIQGGRYETKINIGAYDSRASFEAEVNGQRLRSDENGTVTYTAAATTPGEKRIHAKIYVKNDNGPAEAYEFDDVYFVAEPVAVVSLTKMNVVYAGIDNPVSISVPGVASHLINVSIPTGGATITKDPAGKAGDYLIRASKLGKITVQVDAKTDGKTMRSMGNKEIRVKKIPKPVLKIGNFKSGDVVTKAELLAIGQIRAAMEDFDFQLPALNIASFDFNVSGSQKMDITGTGRALNPEMKSMLNNAKRGQKVTITNVVVKTPDGVTHNLDATFRIK